jgi:hypothetical protein
MPYAPQNGQGRPTFARRKRHERMSRCDSRLDCAHAGTLAHWSMLTVQLTRTVLQRLAVLAMLLPFLAGQVLPAGVMPGRPDDGILTLVLCTPNGPQEIQVDLGSGDDAPRPETAACPWAMLHAVVLLPEVWPGLAVPVILSAGNFQPPTDTGAPVLSQVGPFARAPPLPA